MTMQREADTILPQQAPAKGGGLAIAALVLGIVGAVFGLIPLTGFIALICGTLALIFGIKGKHSENAGMAKGGRILGVLAIAMGVYGLYVMATAVEQLEEDLQEIQTDFEADMSKIEAETNAEMQQLESQYPEFFE